MEVSISIIWLVVAFLCFCCFALGMGIAFFLMARDKNLVRLQPGQVVADQNFINQLVEATNQKRKSTGNRYDGHVPADEFGE